MIAMAAPIALWYQDFDRLSEQILARDAEQGFGLSVGENDMATLIHDKHRVGSGIQEKPKVRLDPLR
jgi:hypothetical protein